MHSNTLLVNSSNLWHLSASGDRHPDVWRLGQALRSSRITAGMATGFAVIPVNAQIDLQSQRAVRGGPILAIFIWRSNVSVTFHRIYSIAYCMSYCNASMFSLSRTWRFGGAGLECARLLVNRFGQRVAPANDLSSLVALHVSHSHADAAGLGALFFKKNKWKPCILYWINYSYTGRCLPQTKVSCTT